MMNPYPIQRYPAVDDGFDESVSGSDSDGGEEEGDADFAEHEVGACGGVGDQMEVGSEASDEDGDDERSAGEAEFDGLGNVHQGNRAEQYAECDSDEDGD